MLLTSAARRLSSNPDRGLGLSFLLGNDYERKKNKLQQELQMDYKHYVAKKNDLKTNVPRPQPQGLSLPIGEDTSVQEKLRAERKREYNLFLQDKCQIRRLKRGRAPVTLKPGQVEPSDAVNTSSPASPLTILNTHTNTYPSPREHPASRRDAATLTEAVDNGTNTGTWGPGRRGRRRWQVHILKEPYSSEEEPITEKEDKEERRTRERRADRAPWDIKAVEASRVHDQNNNECVQKSDVQMPESIRTAARTRPATSKDKVEFATGLMIGVTEEQTASQMRKEQYNQELLKQIAEQQRNKIREKKLLRAAATGATYPEKQHHLFQPDRIQQFGAVNRQYDSWRRDVPYKPGIDPEAMGKYPHPTPTYDKPTEDTQQRSGALSQLTGKTVPGSVTRAARGVSPLHFFNEDYHRDFSNVLGEVANLRVAGVPLPVPPTVTNDYKTPYDAAYHYYGTRNPLDPYLPDNHNDLPGGVQPLRNFYSPPQRPPPFGPSGRTEITDQHRASPLNIGELPADQSKQRKENALSYKEALRQQIKEREERRRREKEEKKRYDAKIEAEMKAYCPWERSGGGAPIKDQKGNIVCDLNHMHRNNEALYRNPVSRNSGQTQSFLMRNGHTVEARAPLSHQLSGFNNQPTPKQLHMQDRYKEDLKQQIYDDKRRQAEEKERMRIEEENEERRLADQRACMQREFEEEQTKKKKSWRKHKNQDWIHEPKRQQQEKKRVEREEEIEKKVPESTREREEQKAQLSYEREPSPPIPTLQRKQTNLVASRPSSVASQLSTRTERSVSPPHSSPVPAKIPQLQDHQQLASDHQQLASDHQQEVIRELSALRRCLKKEQRQLEVQQTDRQQSHYAPANRPRGRPRVYAFESKHKQAVQPSTRSPFAGDAHVNMQNIREFNQLKYRDSASREEVRHMYPDPPTDAQSLDIQQQALLREQQRKIRHMKRKEEHDYLDQKASHNNSRNKPGRYIQRDSILPSETAFIDVYSGDPCEERVHQQRPCQPSAERHERTAPWRTRDSDKVAVCMGLGDCNIQPDAQSLQAATSLNLETEVKAHNQQRIPRQNTGDHCGRSEGPSGDEVDVLSLRSALERRVSMETVATEAWLRPGTSDTVKRSGCRERPNSRMDAPPWLSHRVT